jgi:hypothetical protein
MGFVLADWLRHPEVMPVVYSQQPVCLC